MTSTKFVSSASQLDPNNQGAAVGNQLVSIFGNSPGVGAPGNVKLKVKAPNRNNIKEKE